MRSCISLVSPPDQVVVLVFFLVELAEELLLEAEDDPVDLVHLGLLLLSQSPVHPVQTLAVLVALGLQSRHLLLQPLERVLGLLGRAGHRGELDVRGDVFGGVELALVALVVQTVLLLALHELFVGCG